MIFRASVSGEVERYQPSQPLLRRRRPDDPRPRPPKVMPGHECCQPRPSFTLPAHLEAELAKGREQLAAEDPALAALLAEFEAELSERVRRITQKLFESWDWEA